MTEEKGQTYTIWFCMSLLCFCLGITSCMGSNQSISELQIDSQEAPVERLAEPAKALLFVEYRNHPNFRISQMDLNSDGFIELFNIPQNGWINQLDLSSDGRLLALSYTSPPENAQAALYRSAGIYLMVLDEMGLPTQSEPVPLLEPEEDDVDYYNPIWTPDGRYIFYIRTTPTENAERPEGSVDIMLMRYEMETRASREIGADGIWLRVSPNGQRLTYITVNPVTMERGLVATDLEGNALTQLIPAGDFFDIDSPLFSSDSQWVYFTAAEEEPTTVNDSSSQAIPWWMHLLGTSVASAHSSHNLPSEWWRVPASGGIPEQLTNQGEIIIYGAFDYATEQLYYTTMTGLFVLDGDKIEQLHEARYYQTFAVR